MQHNIGYGRGVASLARSGDKAENRGGGESFDGKLLQYFKSYVDYLCGWVVNFVSPLSNTTIWR